MKIICHLAVLFLLQFLSCKQASQPPGSQPQQKSDKAGAANMVFKSMDGGQNWQDISEGLPGDKLEGSLFVNDRGFYLRTGNYIYHNKPNNKAPYWEKEIFPDEHSSIAPGKSEIAANNYWGVNLKTTNGTSVWSPIFENSEPRMRSIFETAGGTIFIGTDRGFFRSIDNGKTWKHVHAGRLVGHLAESDGVLLAISTRRIIRSTDNGENWEFVTSEDNVAWDVKQIKAGFAAVTAGSESGARSLKTSCDAGKTWQPIAVGDKVFSDSIWRTLDDRLLLKAFPTSITQVGENFVCVHPDGIFRSSDKGKTWKLLLPSIGGKVFNLFGSGNLIYAIPSKGGC